MNQQYQINLAPNEDEVESFEVDDKNLAEIRVQLPGKKLVSSSEYKVELTLSPDAMIGLGTELIRKGLRIKSGKTTEVQEFEHLTKLNSSTPCQKVGIFLTLDSCDLLIACDDLGKVGDAVRKLKSEK